MPITNYSELQTAVGNWLNRSDLTTVLPDFVALAEASLRRRIRRKTQRATLSLDSATVALPADVKELRAIVLYPGTERETPLNIVTRVGLADVRAGSQPTGRPRAAAIVGTDLLLAPAPDQTYEAEITYYAAIPPLTGTAPTNWLLTEAPDVYLFASLVQAEPYLEHDARVVLWQTALDNAIRELDIAHDGEEFTAAPRPVRLRRPL